MPEQRHHPNPALAKGRLLCIGFISAGLICLTTLIGCSLPSIPTTVSSETPNPEEERVTEATPNPSESPQLKLAPEVFKEIPRQKEPIKTEVVEDTPKTPPINLEAKKYYDQGVKQKLLGWPDRARITLKKAVKLDPNGEIGQRAQRYINAKLPRHPVSKEALQGNIIGYNQWHSGHIEQAKDTFKQLIRAYPNFEWPYGNLASIYIEQNKLRNAQILLERVLKINPNYANGWIHYAEYFDKKGNDDEAIRCLKQVLIIDPDNTNARGKLQAKLAQRGRTDEV